MSSGRYALARSLGRAAAALSRRAGLGAGTTIGGRVTLAVDPEALHRAAGDRRIALISGTNGKTTTRSMLAAALAGSGRVVSNSGGANLPSGLTAALLADRAAPLGVLEVDEPYLPAVIQATAPALAVLLNLSRDQLDRYAEVRRLSGIWRAALATPGAPRVVANADDPLVVWAANAAPTRTWVAAGLRWRQDSTACPQCGGLIQFNDEGWSSDCGLRRPVPDWLLADGKLRDPEGTLHDLELRLPGPFNRGNAALATAAAADFGVPAAQALAALAGISAVEGRYLEREYRGRRLRLLLAKNPAGWQEALSVVAPPPAAAVVSVNARAADGRDPAWLWDVQFELLAGRYVVATGERARDVAVRLRYAGVRHTRVDDPRHALLSAPPGQVEVLANYTAFQRLHRMLARG